MSTALDVYKKYYGVEHDGAAVLKHAEFGHFRDPVMGMTVTPDKLKELGVIAEMSREQILDCLYGQPGTLDSNDEKVKLLYRYGLQRVIDFCCAPAFSDDGERKSVIPQKEHKTPLIDRISYKIDPILDAVMRRLFLGHWDKKKKQ